MKSDPDELAEWYRSRGWDSVAENLDTSENSLNEDLDRLLEEDIENMSIQEMRERLDELRDKHFGSDDSASDEAEHEELTEVEEFSAPSSCAYIAEGG